MEQARSDGSPRPALKLLCHRPSTRPASWQAVRAANQDMLCSCSSDKWPGCIGAACVRPGRLWERSRCLISARSLPRTFLSRSARDHGQMLRPSSHRSVQPDVASSWRTIAAHPPCVVPVRRARVWWHRRHTLRSLVLPCPVSPATEAEAVRRMAEPRMERANRIGCARRVAFPSRSRQPDRQPQGSLKRRSTPCTRLR